MKKTTLLLTSIFAVTSAIAQNKAQDQKGIPEAGVIQCSEFHISQPLSDLYEKDAVDETEDIREKVEIRDRDGRPAQVYQFKAADGAQYGNDPSSVQTSMGTRAPMAPLTNWAGQNGGGSYPPDPTGACGTNYYVQSVNATPFKVFNKTTGTQVGTVKNIGALWSPATANMGDPIVLYDKYADRWFLSQFGQSGSTNYIYIAVSQTNNPGGAYYCYTFTSPAFPDYLKFSVWQDAYYMCSNGQTRAFAFQRDQMLLGNAAAKCVYASYTQSATSGFFCPLPADADGTLPAAGQGCPFFAYTDNGWGGGAVDGVKIWTMTVNWTTPAMTISAPVTVTTAAFDASYNSSWDDITQPTAGYKLDGIGGVVTFRAQWRKWTGYNSVVLNWGVLISSSTGQRSIKWVELRQNQSTGVWTLKQEGTYTPDAHSRWVGSIAMDDNGAIALCYAKASATLSASLAYTGRLSTDPLGTMTFAEVVATTGSGTQTAANRFGDYSQTTLDPSDGVTFWHTGEYILAGNPASRVYSFRLTTPSGVEEASNQPSLTVNQSNGAINVNAVNLPTNNELVVDLFDITGKQISGKKITPSGNALQTSFDASQLAKGTYLVRIGEENTSFQKVTKLVIN